MSKGDVSLSLLAKDKTKAAFDACRKHLNSLGKGFAAVSAAAVAGFAVIANKVLESGDKMHKFALRIGTSTEALSQLQHAAGLSGVSMDTLSMGMQRMTRRISEAAAGGGPAAKAIEELGLSAEHLKSLTPEKQFEEIADALQGVGHQSDKTRLAMNLFDSEGVALLQMMTDGASGIQKMREEADELGLTLSGDGANAIADFNDSISRIKAAITGFVQGIVTKAAPALTDLFNNLAKRIPQAADIAGQKIGQWANWVLNKFTDISDWFGDNEQTVKVWGQSLELVWSGIKTIVRFVAWEFEMAGKAIGYAIAKVMDFYDWVMKLGAVNMVMEFFTKASPIRPFSEGMQDIERRLSGFSARVSNMNPQLTVGASMPASAAPAASVGAGSAPMFGPGSVVVSPMFMSGDRNAANSVVDEIARLLEFRKFRLN